MARGIQQRELEEAVDVGTNIFGCSAENVAASFLLPGSLAIKNLLTLRLFLLSVESD